MDRDRGNGFEVRLGDVVFSVSSALDLVSPEVVGHHLRVARIARAIARELGFTREQLQDLLLAAALHDSGAFSLRERLDDHAVRNPASRGSRGGGVPALEVLSALRAGGRDRSLPPPALGASAAASSGGGGRCRLRSHLLHLADRVSVLAVDRGGWPRGWAAAIARSVRSGSGSRFKPEFVEALRDGGGPSRFLGRDVGRGDDDLRNDPAFGDGDPLRGRLQGARAPVLADRGLSQPVHRDAHQRRGGGRRVSRAARRGRRRAGRMVAIAAGLHDLGKLAVPSETLEKEQPLTRDGGRHASQPPAARLADPREDRGPGGDQPVGELPPRASRRPGVPVPASGRADAARKPDRGGGRRVHGTHRGAPLPAGDERARGRGHPGRHGGRRRARSRRRRA